MTYLLTSYDVRKAQFRKFLGNVFLEDVQDGHIKMSWIFIQGDPPRFSRPENRVPR